MQLKDNDSEFIKSQTVIGQGKTLVTPIHMLMLYSSVANDGIVMKPYMIEGVISKNGKEIHHFSPQKNGRIWVLAYGSNELLNIDVNGSILSRNRGPLNGFDRPMDIIETKDGCLLITESAGDRITSGSRRGRNRTADAGCRRLRPCNDRDGRLIIGATITNRGNALRETAGRFCFVKTRSWWDFSIYFRFAS